MRCIYRRLGPNYPASKSTIHPAPKFRFSEERLAKIKYVRKPNWVDSNKFEISKKGNQKTKVKPTIPKALVKAPEQSWVQEESSESSIPVLGGGLVLEKYPPSETTMALMRKKARPPIISRVYDAVKSTCRNMRK